MTPTVITKRRPLLRATTRLVRQPGGGYQIEPLVKEAGEYVSIAKTSIAKDLVKKRVKAEAKDNKKKAKLRAKQNQRNSDIAEHSAIIARERLNMGKSLDIIRIAKSIISAGGDAQPGTTSRTLFAEMEKRAEAMFSGQPLSPEQKFARYAATPEGEILFKASRKAVQEPWDAEDDDDEDEKDDGTSDSYKKLMAKAAELRAVNPHLSQAQVFSRLYSDPANRRLAKADQEAHLTKVAKSVGLR